MKETKQSSAQPGLAQNASAPHLHQVGMAQLVSDVRRIIQRDYAGLWERRPQLFHLAINEAASLAWLTDIPELVFPVLAQEKIQALAHWHCRQESLFKMGVRSVSGACPDVCSRRRICPSELPVSRCRQHVRRGAERWEMSERHLSLLGIRN